jgi:hypothetical protein
MRGPPTRVSTLDIVKWQKNENCGYKDLEIELGQNKIIFTKMGLNN